MSRYRKIDVRMWNDEKFRDLSDDGKFVFIFVMTHPAMTALGAMRATLPGLAAELGWPAERLSEGFREGVRKGIVEHDERASCVALPNFVKYNQPENPNVVKAWVNCLDLIPECDLKTKTIQRAKAFAEGRSKAFAEALPKAFAEGARKGMAKQEQEQEPEPEQEPTSRGSGEEGLAPTRTHAREGYDFPYDPPPTDDEGRAWLDARGVHPSRIDEAISWLMGQRLYADRLESFKLPKEANAYALATGRAA